MALKFCALKLFKRWEIPSNFQHCLKDNFAILKTFARIRFENLSEQKFLLGAKRAESLQTIDVYDVNRDMETIFAPTIKVSPRRSKLYA
jgi:hypothetical protein